MLCVSIARSHPSNLREEHAALAKAGAKLVEYRLDVCKAKPDVPALLKDRPTPVIVTCRRRQDGGKWRGTEAERLALLRQAIVAGADYVDLEADVAGSVPRFGAVKRVVSHHDFAGTPDGLADLHAKLAGLDADVVKLVTTAKSPADCAAVLGVVKRAKVPTVGFCMGEHGQFSRILCLKFGSPWTYATFSSDRELAPGMMSFRLMKRVYDVERVQGSTAVFGVLGDPVAHSLSPHVHNAALRATRTDAVYVPVRVSAEEFEAEVNELAELGFTGFSVTIPHKRAAADWAGHRDELVGKLQAANTLVRCGGRWEATNTDYAAARDAVFDTLRERDPDATFEGRRALVLGTGGAARAVATALADAGMGTAVSGRSAAKTEKLAAAIGGKMVTWPNRGTEPADVIVNCTPVGMWPDVDDCPLPENQIPTRAVVFDTVYNPENTLLLKRAKQRECVTIPGVEMFVRQAAAQFELFTGKPAPLPVMREAFRRAISAVN